MNSKEYKIRKMLKQNGEIMLLSEMYFHYKTDTIILMILYKTKSQKLIGNQPKQSLSLIWSMSLMNGKKIPPKRTLLKLGFLRLKLPITPIQIKKEAACIKKIFL